MNEKSEIIQVIEASEVALLEEIGKSELGISNKPIRQLKTIAYELEMMKIESGFVPVFPSFIIDSWDYDDPLGRRLLELYLLYKR